MKCLVSARDLLLVVVVCCSTQSSLFAQEEPSSTVQDSMLSAPRYSGPDGQKDPTALQIVRKYLAAVNVDRSGSMRAEGTIVIGSGAAQQRGFAAMTIEGTKRFRFDIETSAGKVSTRIDGMSGSLQKEGMGVSRIPRETASSGALISPWMLLELIDNPIVSVTGGESLVVDNDALYKVTLYRPICLPFSCPDHLQKIRLTTDLYFDTQSHLLIKSAETIRISETSPSKVLRVISYGKYSQVGQSLAPHKYAETLNGQSTWSFDASSVSFTEHHESSYFHF